jgi:hypothetical protein
MKVVTPNAFGSSARRDPKRALVGAVGRGLQDLYAEVLQVPLPAALQALARRMDDQSRAG